jgi:hypothetical protein
MKDLKGSRHEGIEVPRAFAITLPAFTSFMIFIFKASQGAGHREKL